MDLQLGEAHAAADVAATSKRTGQQEEGDVLMDQPAHRSPVAAAWGSPRREQQIASRDGGDRAWRGQSQAQEDEEEDEQQQDGGDDTEQDLSPTVEPQQPESETEDEAFFAA